MKAFKTVLKILAALAAVAGIVFVVATYGDRIVAWAKQLLEKLSSWRCGCDEVEFIEGDAEEADFEG